MRQLSTIRLERTQKFAHLHSLCQSRCWRWEIMASIMNLLITDSIACLLVDILYPLIMISRLSPFHFLKVKMVYT